MADLVTNAQVLAAWSGLAKLDSDEQAALITAASDAVERYCLRTFGAADYTEALSGKNLPRVWLSNRPVITVTSVTADGDAIDNTYDDGWTVSPNTGELLRGPTRGDPRFAPWWPWGRNNIVVEYTAGYALPTDESPPAGALPLPPSIIRATCLMVRHVAEAMRSIGPIKKEKLGEYEYELETVETMPPIVALLLQPFIQVSL